MTTLSERQWERRLVGDTIWLVECYAAWCPACRASMPTWQAAGALMRDDDVEVGAINCEKQRQVCTDEPAPSPPPLHCHPPATTLSIRPSPPTPLHPPLSTRP